jgi:hypothetical protein
VPARRTLGEDERESARLATRLTPQLRPGSDRLQDLSAIPKGRLRSQLTRHTKERQRIIARLDEGENAGSPAHQPCGVSAARSGHHLGRIEDAWAEIAPNVDSDPIMVEATRLSLATIVLTLAKAGPIDRGKIHAAPAAFWQLMARCRTGSVSPGVRGLVTFTDLRTLSTRRIAGSDFAPSVSRGHQRRPEGRAAMALER